MTAAEKTEGTSTEISSAGMNTYKILTGWAKTARWFVHVQKVSEAWRVGDY